MTELTYNWNCPQEGWHTAAGVPFAEIGDRLAEPFDNPEKAYKQIQGGRGGAAGLTDIHTGFQMERLNQVFGLRGIGWNLEYDLEDLELFPLEGPLGSEKCKDGIGWLKLAYFVFPLFDKDGQLATVARIQTDGMSKNAVEYALEGARTKAIGQAIKWLNFQLFVYKDLITSLPRGAKSEAKPDSTKGGAKTTTKQTKKTPPAKQKSDEQKPEGGNGKPPTPSFSIANYEKAAAYKVPEGLPNANLPLVDSLSKPNGRIVLEYLAGLKPSPETKEYYNLDPNFDQKLENAAGYVLQYESLYTEKKPK